MAQQGWNRVEKWAVLLGGVIEKHNELPFKYGVSDCGILVADAVKAIMGKDVLAPYRKYKTKMGAAKVLAKADCANVGELFAKHFQEGHKAHALRGDIGVVDFNGEVCGGVFTGFGFAAKSESGIFFADYDQISRVFEVR